MFSVRKIWLSVNSYRAVELKIISNQPWRKVNVFWKSTQEVKVPECISYQLLYILDYAFRINA